MSLTEVCIDVPNVLKDLERDHSLRGHVIEWERFSWLDSRDFRRPVDVTRKVLAARLSQQMFVGAVTASQIYDA